MAELPQDLLFAVSSLKGGKLSLILGAGCSMEPPSNLPGARKCSSVIHSRLVADGILDEGECAEPEDLSLLTDMVVEKTGSQSEVVKRLLDEYDLKKTSPNSGYLNAAALLIEGAVTSLVTLNFDLAILHALAVLGGEGVGVVECPAEMTDQRSRNVYFLHRSANERDVEAWILRTDALESEWRESWEEVIATKALASSVVVFAGLGSRVAVLVRAVELLRSAVPTETQIFQVDPLPIEQSDFFARLNLPDANYIQRGWCDFMDTLAGRLLKEHLLEMSLAVQTLGRENKLEPQDVDNLLDQLHNLGLLELGKVRAEWLLSDTPYLGARGVANLFADILLGLARIESDSGADVTIGTEGAIDFARDGRLVSRVLIASGGGYRTRAAVEAKMNTKISQAGVRIPTCIIAFGTSDGADDKMSPPRDVARLDFAEGDLMAGPSVRLRHIEEFRRNAKLLDEVVP